MKRCIIIFICTIGLFVSRLHAQLSIKEGNNAVYLFLTAETPGVLNTSSEFSEVKVYRVYKNKSEEIGSLNKAGSPEMLKELTHANILKFIMDFKGLNSEEEAWHYFKTHPKQSDYGLLVMNPDFLVALGVCFKDTFKDSQKGNVLKYKVSYFPKMESTEPKDIFSEIKLKGRLQSTRPKTVEYIQSDSIINVKWEMPTEKSHDAIMATIYRKEGNYGDFKKLQKIMMMNSDDGAKKYISYSEKVKPHRQYSYYTKPTSISGLEGLPSDTISVISKTFSNIPQVEVMTVRDTTSGLLIAWKENLKTQKFTAGIVLERSLDSKSGYVSIDTISKQSNSYLDVNVLPNILYHYRLRFLSINNILMQPSAYVSGIHQDNNAFIEPPTSLQIKPSKNDVLLVWNRSIFPEVSGYYVYRTKSGKDDWRLISNYVKDTLFVDKTVQSKNTVYKYALTAVGYSGNESNLSSPVFGTISKNEKPIAPIGLQAAKINNAIDLFWRTLNTNDIAHPTFNVYRANGNVSKGEAGAHELGFKKINKTVLTSKSFTDNTIVNGNTYSYAVSIIDDFGNESDMSVAIYVRLPNGALRAPINVGARKIEGSIILSWDKHFQKDVTGYAIYRRIKGETEYIKIGAVNKNQVEYKDTDVLNGTFCYYAISVLSKSNESNKSIEFGLQH